MTSLHFFQKIVDYSCFNKGCFKLLPVIFIVAEIQTQNLRSVLVRSDRLGWNPSFPTASVVAGSSVLSSTTFSCSSKIIWPACDSVISVFFGVLLFLKIFSLEPCGFSSVSFPAFASNVWASVILKCVESLLGSFPSRIRVAIIVDPSIL